MIFKKKTSVSKYTYTYVSKLINFKISDYDIKYLIKITEHMVRSTTVICIVPGFFYLLNFQVPKNCCVLKHSCCPKQVRS